MVKPTILVFAGPNGSGKSTVTSRMDSFGVYVNADDLKREYGLTDIEAAQMAESVRNKLLDDGVDFSFETVLSTERNLLLLQKAKERGYFVQCVYVLTCDENINVERVKQRVEEGGHDVPEDKIRSRYHKALALLPRLVDVCDDIAVYDNSDLPTLIASKRSATGVVLHPCETWPKPALEKLLSICG